MARDILPKIFYDFVCIALVLNIFYENQNYQYSIFVHHLHCLSIIGKQMHYMQINALYANYKLKQFIWTPWKKNSQYAFTKHESDEAHYMIFRSKQIPVV